MGIDEEQRQDLAVAGLGWVCEGEGLHLVLEQIGEGEKTTFSTSYRS